MPCISELAAVVRGKTDGRRRQAQRRSAGRRFRPTRRRCGCLLLLRSLAAELTAVAARAATELVRGAALGTRCHYTPPWLDLPDQRTEERRAFLSRSASCRACSAQWLDAVRRCLLRFGRRRCFADVCGLGRWVGAAAAPSRLARSSSHGIRRAGGGGLAVSYSSPGSGRGFFVTGGGALFTGAVVPL